MRDIPLFTLESGIASLFLRNIPYTKKAYVKILNSDDLTRFLDECISFCRSAGAESVYATGYSGLSAYPVATKILKMECCNPLPETDAILITANESNMEQWRNIYNDKMREVPNASQIGFAEAKKYLDSQTCYFVQKGKFLLGIGVASNDRIDAIASLQPGAGMDVVCALSKAISSSRIQLQVADSNCKAISLYRGLGFVVTEETEIWYKIF